MQMNKKNMSENIIIATGDGGSRIHTNSAVINQHKIRLNGDITEPESFREELNVIENLGENDSVTLVINTNGGELDSAVEFCSAIVGSEGYVHGHISGCAHSAGSMIFLKCHSYSVSPYATMLIHCPSGGFLGKFADTFSEAEHYREWTRFFYEDVYSGFLTQEELDRVLDGKDMWLNARQIEERLHRMIEIKQLEEENRQPEELFDQETFGDNPDEVFTADSEKCVDDEPSTVPQNLVERPPEESFEESSTVGLVEEKTSEKASYRSVNGAFVGKVYSWDGLRDAPPANLHRKDLVKVCLENGEEEVHYADSFYWEHTKDELDIVSYELVEPYEENNEV